jgi:hypothetical protein
MTDLQQPVGFRRVPGHSEGCYDSGCCGCFSACDVHLRVLPAAAREQCDVRVDGVKVLCSSEAQQISQREAFAGLASIQRLFT